MHRGEEPAEVVDWARLDIGQLMSLEAADDDVFVSRHNEDNGAGRIFGGQILGQSLAAVARTVPPQRRVHSLHLTFCAAGRPSLPVHYKVERLRDGASASVRGVRAEQGGRIVCVATASCRGQEVGFDHDDAIALDVAGPFAHTDAKAMVHRDPDTWKGHPLDFVSRKGSIELRLVHAPRDFSDAPQRRGGELLHVWVRSPSTLLTEPFMHQCAVAYLTDYVLAHVPPLQRMPYVDTKRIAAASVNHALWFYRPFKADEWLLVEIACPVAAAGRGLATAKVYDVQRRVVAVTTQECVYREKEPRPEGSTSPREIQPGTNA